MSDHRDTLAPSQNRSQRKRGARLLEDQVSVLLARAVPIAGPCRCGAVATVHASLAAPDGTPIGDVMRCARCYARHMFRLTNG